MIIAIAGGSGSGKTTVAKQIQSSYAHDGNIVVISMDNYYKNILLESFDNYDHPEAFDMEILYSDLMGFLLTKSMPIRSYDFVSKKSHISHTKANISLLILEGLYPFYIKKIRDLCSLKIYLDIEESIRIQRRISRDVTQRNIPIKENLKMINEFVKKMHQKYVTKQKKMANHVYTKSNKSLKAPFILPLPQL